MRPCLVLVIALAAGCDDLTRFRTDPGTVFRGEVVGDEESSFIRRGFPPFTEMELEFDALDSDSISPGAITTSADPQTGERIFDSTPLETIAPLEHDQLSEYDLPGGGRVRNYIFVARPEAGPLAGRDATVFVSLMQSGDVEMRVIAGSGRRPGDHYGFFRLRRVVR